MAGPSGREYRQVVRRRRSWLSALAVASVITGCLGTERSDPAQTSGNTAATSTSASTTTLAATTSTSATTTTAPASTTTTSTTLVWQQFPIGPVTPLRARTIHSYSRIDTTDPVVFITIDDGFVRDPRVPELLEQRQAPATLFLISGSIQQDPEYFRRFLALGGSINTHTRRHAYLPGMSPADQQDEICAATYTIEHTYGSAGYFFRPPRGESDENTLSAARACGARAMILWRVTVHNGVINTWGTRPIMPGDIILLHFLSTTYDSLVVLFAELDRLGLTVARLEDYLPAA